MSEENKKNEHTGDNLIKAVKAGIENGRIVEKEVRYVPQSHLTSDCWSIQFWGLEECMTCEYKNTPDCGGGETLKRLIKAEKEEGESSSPQDIAMKNDLFREAMGVGFPRGQVVMTRGVASLPEMKLFEVLNTVRTFSDFNEDNDPYREHDFGAFEVDGERYFFKFDYYDRNFEYFQKDGNRVLTIMRAEEY